MFAYIDPTVRATLVAQGKLARIDSQGNRLDPNGPVQPGSVLLNVLGPVPLPVRLGEREISFQWYAFVRHTELAEANELADALRGRGEPQLFAKLSTAMSVNSVLCLGDMAAAEAPLVRVHSCCMTGDVFGSQRCECGPQLHRAFERIDDEGAGAVVYMSGHEGRGIGLWAKAVTYLLQDGGQDTYQANHSLGLPDDCRQFNDAAAVLRFLRGGDRPIRLMSNNPKKLADLREGGLSHIASESHVTGVTRFNRRYLDAKRGWGHKLDLDELDEESS